MTVIMKSTIMIMTTIMKSTITMTDMMNLVEAFTVALHLQQEKIFHTQVNCSGV